MADSATLHLGHYDLRIFVEGLRSSVKAHGLDFHACIGATPEEAVKLAGELEIRMRYQPESMPPISVAFSRNQLRLLRAALVETALILHKRPTSISSTSTGAFR